MNELTADNLHLWRGDTHVLRGVSLASRGGQCLQVTGANGAGKTTLLRALCGLIPLEEGQVRWCGLPISDDLAAFHDALAYLGHDNALKADLSAEENLRYGAGLRRRLGPADIAAALARMGLVAQQLLPVRQLSAGQRRRVALARLILSDAQLWLLDEPGSNLDASGLRLLHTLLAAHLQAGGTAVVATHQVLELAPGNLKSLPLQ
ncbi:MAG TPA: cytochrome c biogenesis heme-transporting ATPase CcmA [Steroidobacteraceae bacterium]|jgi:heme exporter protein A